MSIIYCIKFILKFFECIPKNLSKILTKLDYLNFCVFSIFIGASHLFGIQCVNVELSFFLTFRKIYFQAFNCEYFMYVCVHVCMTEIKEEGRKDGGGKKEITKTERKKINSWNIHY